VLRTVFSCVVNSHDFNQLCYLYGVSVMSMKFSELTCAVYEHFRASTMWLFFFLYCVYYCVVEVLVVVFVCLSVCLFVFNPCCRPILSSWRINVGYIYSARPMLPSQSQSITAPWLVPSYTAWWQRRVGVNNLPKVVTQLCPEYRNWTHDLLIASPTLYPLRHRATSLIGGVG